MRRFTLGLTLAAVLVPATALAAISMQSDDKGARMTLGGDLYIAGDEVRIDSAVGGDLNAAGNSVTVTQAIGGTIQAAGRMVSIRGAVDGSIRAVGQTVTIEGPVNGNVLAFGENLVIASGAVIEGDLLAGGTNVTIQGIIRGTAKIDAESVDMSGTIGGVGDIGAQRVTLAGKIGSDAILRSKQITVAGNGAGIAGNSRFWTEAGTADQRNLQTITAGTATYDATLERVQPQPTRKSAAAAILGALSIFSLLTGALLILVLQLVTKTLFVNAGATLRSSPWMSLLVGLVYFLVLPIFALLLLITLIGWPLAIVAALLWIISLLLAKALASVVLTRAVEQHLKAKWSPVGVFFASLGIFVALRLLALVPVIGWIVSSLLVCAAFGAYLLTKGKIFGKVR